MIRKPKIYNGLKLVGINFRERWNVVEHATIDELKLYINNFNYIKKEQFENLDKSWWDRRQAIINERIQNVHLRKVWRKRHSESFKPEILYRVDRNIARWNTKLGPSSGEGLATAYQFERTRDHTLIKDDIVVLTKTDEMGNLYFAKISDINSKHPYVFNRDNAQLSWILPIDT